MKTLKELMIHEMNQYLPTVWEYDISQSGVRVLYVDWLASLHEETFLEMYRKALLKSVEDTHRD